MEAKQISENTTLYTSTQDPSHSFTFTYQGKVPTNLYGTICESESWVYRPTDENPEMIANKSALELIKSIASKLPNISLPMDQNEYDYPVIQSSAFNMCGVDYHLKREVFAIGGHVFFRRYNDDWNGVVMCSDGPHGSSVSWKFDIGRAALEKLNTLINKKDPRTVSFEEVSTCLTRY
ncbi:putative ORFan [Tupanvirus deep ocean]|uniref:ORFan n=2 Tax=Tupanvirus TaxID=2094720 RepID=A0AC62AAD2_9VIRU|nr:putative ORFan [Tupanvirus deep ocean]QKU34583.1 putative ORFan [Tupanvirus deep ocean]